MSVICWTVLLQMSIVKNDGVDLSDDVIYVDILLKSTFSLFSMPVSKPSLSFKFISIDTRDVQMINQSEHLCLVSRSIRHCQNLCQTKTHLLSNMTTMETNHAG